ncbi:MAG: tail fiber domain-containing protein [Dysgonamonadaceae bacterium]|jgi:hypothetical protein|nr:tail fiber domain-containing protein [Dysgonamonadaceae bacterium]
MKTKKVLLLLILMIVGVGFANAAPKLTEASYTSSNSLEVNAQNSDNSLDVVLEMRSVIFNYPNDPTEREVFGFMSNELREVLPAVVGGEGIAYSGGTFLLINSLN